MEIIPGCPECPGGCCAYPEWRAYCNPDGLPYAQENGTIVLIKEE